MMKQAKIFIFATAVAVATLCARQAWACPHCNIHNYLAGSVRSSTNVFHGSVVRQIDDRTAEVEVLKVLRGKHKVGSKVKTEMYGSREFIGKKFIFSDPTSSPPTFEVLPLEFEDEVLFLMHENPSVKSAKEAIKRVQGVSVMTQGIGMEYLTNHYDEAVGSLVAELDTLMPAVFSTNEVFFGEHRLGKLLEALLSRESDQAKEFAVSYIGKMATQDGNKVDWSSIPYNASSRGVFLRDLLRHSRKHDNLTNALHRQVKPQLPKLSELALADAVYGVVVTQTDTVSGLQKNLEATASSDLIALGLYFAGNYEARWWQHDKACAFWDEALSLAKRKELKEAISTRIKDSEKFWKRKHTDANKAIDSDKE